LCAPGLRAPLPALAILGVLGILGPAAVPAAAAPLGALGEPDRLVVRGVTALDPEQLRRPLTADTDLVWLSRPHASRDAYLAAVARKATLALERAGFAKADVKAAVESSDGVDRLVLSVTEGPRLETGAIEITGLPADTAARLERALSEPQPAADAVPAWAVVWSTDKAADPAANAAAGNAGADVKADVKTADQAPPQIEWVAPDGCPARRERPLWEPGRPAPCDAATLHHVRVAVARFLRQEGYLTIAAVPDRRPSGRPARGSGTKGEIDVAVRQGDGVADLVVTVATLPPKAVLRRIDVAAGARTSERDLAAYLGITTGRPVTEIDRLAWRERLRQSGRFLRHDVEFRADALDPAAVSVRFDLEEYPAATPLSSPLSREETAILAVRRWLLDANRSDDDLVVDVRDAAAPAGGVAARATVSATAGVLLESPVGGPDAAGLYVGGTAAALLLPTGQGRFELPLPTGWNAAVQITLSLVRDPSAPADQPKFTRNLSCGVGLAGAGSGGDATGIDLRLEPVAFLALVHEGAPSVSFDDATMTIEADGVAGRFDEHTGRPLAVTVAGRAIAFETRSGAVAESLGRLREAAGPDRARQDAIVTSAVEFFLSDDVAAATARIATAFGLSSEERDRWQQRLAGAIAAARRCAADGGLSRGDEAIAAAVKETAGEPVAAVGDAAAVPPAQPEPLEIPEDEEPTSPAAVQKLLVRRVAAVLWRTAERLCGRDSWPASLVRAGACAAAGDPAILDEMTRFMSVEAYGPLAHVAAASVTPVAVLSASLARRGQERLSAIAFRTDCHPLLKAARSCGIDEPCVALLRGCDDEAVAGMGGLLCGDPQAFVPLVRSLRGHERPEDAVAGLQTALDAWWSGALRGIVAARLDAIATPRTATATDGRDGKPLKK
jgi:hypothetical protein